MSYSKNWNNKKWDFIIVGAGVAGRVCAYMLSNRGFECLVLEKNKSIIEKICGGGVSYKALNLLKDIGMDTSQLFKMDSKEINGHYFIYKSKIIKKKYPENSLGIRRELFDRFIMKYAIERGATYLFNEQAKISADNKVNEYNCKKIILATGANSLTGSVIKNQSIGYSAQIIAISILSPDKFYYWFYDSDNRYFWAFPIGKDLWNVGIWSPRVYNGLKKDFFKYLDIFFLKTLKGSWEFLRYPKAGFIGNIDQRCFFPTTIYGVGDFAGCANSKNGGGIIGAIESSVCLAKNIEV